LARERSYDDADPTLATLRRLCAGLPGSVERETWGLPTFRAPDKLYAVYGAGADHPCALVFKPDDDERPALVADARFFSPPYFGPNGWLALDLGGGTDWAEVAELLASSFRQVAPAELVRRLDAQGPPAPTAD
jgi:predicted DNA-binding protein (MmcQ/YjbR family)